MANNEYTGCQGVLVGHDGVMIDGWMSDVWMWSTRTMGSPILGSLYSQVGNLIEIL